MANPECGVAFCMKLRYHFISGCPVFSSVILLNSTFLLVILCAVLPISIYPSGAIRSADSVSSVFCGSDLVKYVSRLSGNLVMKKGLLNC